MRNIVNGSRRGVPAWRAIAQAQARRRVVRNTAIAGIARIGVSTKIASSTNAAQAPAIEAQQIAVTVRTP